MSRIFRLVLSDAIQAEAHSDHILVLSTLYLGQQDPTHAKSAPTSTHKLIIGYPEDVLRTDYEGERRTIIMVHIVTCSEKQYDRALTWAYVAPPPARKMKVFARIKGTSAEVFGCGSVSTAEAPRGRLDVSAPCFPRHQKLTSIPAARTPQGSARELWLRCHRYRSTTSHFD